MYKHQEKQYDLHKDGFCFLSSVYSKKEIDSAYKGLNKVINGEKEQMITDLDTERYLNE